jgi:hypothetical protein
MSSFVPSRRPLVGSACVAKLNGKLKENFNALWNVRGKV